MKTRRNNSARASTLQIALSTGLIWIFAILLAIAAPTNSKKAPRQDRYGFQRSEGADADSITALGKYPDTSVPLSGDTTVTPDAAPSNTTSINLSTDTNFEGRLEGKPMTGVVRVTNAHPAGTYTVTLTAFDGGSPTATKTFALTVTTPATCPSLSFATSGNFDVLYYPRSMAVGDFNSDGKQDLATGGEFDVSILLGDGTGHFSAATNLGAGTAYSVAVGDFNGDGNQDVASAEFGLGFVRIMLGDGAGHFSAAARYPLGGPYSIAVGDLNGDGKQDLAVTRHNSSAAVAILLGDGAGHFGAPTSFGPGGNYAFVAVGDFNADGKQDLALADEGSNVSILLGDGAGHFSTPTNFAVGTDPVSVAVGDFNADGKQDLAVANYYSANVSILLGDGTGHFSAATNFVAGGGPRSVAVGDFNGDGTQDLAFANSVTNNASILLGDGAGHFGAPVYLGVGTDSDNPSAVAVGDFNGDGKQDLAVSNNESDDVTILLRDCLAPTPTPTPSATPAICPVNFTPPANFAVGDSPTSVAVGDFNADGNQDLATANNGSDNVSILLADGAGHFSAATNFGAGEGPRSIALGDFNGDGKLDLAVANYFSGNVSVLLGDGTGHFSPATNFPTGSYSTSVAVGDFNADGKQDLAVATGTTGAAAILLGDGTGHFSAPANFAVGSYPASIAVGDFNGDGDQDLAVANSDSGNVSVLLGEGAGHFSAATNFASGSQSTSVAVGDFNADGLQDLVVGHYYSANVTLLLGDGAGHFNTPTNFVSGDSARSVTVGDFNADGHQDIAVANFDSPNVSILLGDGTGHLGTSIDFAAGVGPASTAVGDFNDDGMPDLAVANRTSDDVSILLRVCTPRPTPATTHFLLSAPDFAFQGYPTYLEVRAKDQFNTTVTGYLGTVHFSSSGSAYLPPNCPLPNGSGDFTPTLNTLGYQTITATDTSDPSITGTSNPIFVQSEGFPLPSPSPTATATATAAPTPTATPTPSTTPTPTLTPTATPTPTAPAQSLNLSSRLLVQTGDRVGIAGFIITGGAPKRVIVRAVHCMICIPEVFPLTDPVLELRGPSGFATIINDNWRDTQEADIIATSLMPDNNSDSAIVVTLPPGNYTAIVRGKNDTSGVALVEVYDLSQAAASKLANISTRAFVSTGGNILIAGFILGNGTMPDNVIVRGIGPSLTGLGVPDVLADPTLELRDSNGALIRANDNWMADPAQKALIMAAGLAPTNALESAIAETLPPGPYTALLAGVNNGTGNGLVEVYDLGP